LKFKIFLGLGIPEKDLSISGLKLFCFSEYFSLPPRCLTIDKKIFPAAYTANYKCKQLNIFFGDTSAYNHVPVLRLIFN